MKIYLNLFYLLAVLLFTFPRITSAQIISKEPKDLFITGNESIIFTSKINNKEYKIFVQLPKNYQTNSKQKYPVFYTLDGQDTFAMVSSIYNSIRFDGYVPGIIIIGISYGGEKSSFGSLRISDLTPTLLDDYANSGGAPEFQKVLSDELIPMVDSLYRTDKTNRALAGTSFGGLFTHYTLFTQPKLFNGYIITNPSFGWGDNYVYKLEESFAESNLSINAKVMFVSGEYDMVSDVTKMVNQIKKHQYKNLALNFEVLKEMGHSGSDAESFSHGFNFIYKRPIVILPEIELMKYLGTYKSPEGEIVDIIIKDGELMLTNDNGISGTMIHALSNSDFTFNGKYFDFHFIKNKDGNINGFFLQYSLKGSFTAEKIK